MIDLELLNKEQREAVLHTKGPLLLLAGAGSGKTRVLMYRIAYLIETCEVNPWNILAITFTNKAAGEMRERVDKIVGEGSENIWVSTFHSLCVRILRRHIDKLGYENRFTIYDADDQKTVIKGICGKLSIDTQIYKEKDLLREISHAKEKYQSPKEYQRLVKGDFRREVIANVYQEYQKELKKNNALDFDDLLYLTVELFQNYPEVLLYYQDRFRYIMVDEYQDTNTVQFRLIGILAKKYRNLCVVGDDDQSIYRFRGANVGNILNFEEEFPDTKVIKLEQNYRSTQHILDAANAVIQNNKGRKEKALWTENGQGEPLTFLCFQDASQEAAYLAKEILAKVEKGKARYQDFAVLYRTNAQSRIFEEKFLLSNVPYKMIGGVNFYARKEVKDILAYLKVIDNGRDDLAVHRIINVPKRSIGAVSVGKVQAYANSQEIGFYQALEEASMVPGIGKVLTKIQAFVHLIEEFRAALSKRKIYELIEDILEKSGYAQELREEGNEEAQARMENIQELIHKAMIYERTAKEPSLSGFLEEVALVADIDSLDESDNRVLLLTLHNAKGLEFPYVYLTGMEDGVFPSFLSILAEHSREEIEEERRLCYVGMTRAMKALTMTAVHMRLMHGKNQRLVVSRFVQEVPRELFREKTMPSSVQRTTKSDNSTTYQKAREAFRAKTFEPKQFKVTKAEALEYQTGDRVSHIKFGIGTVLDITEGGKDYEVKVDFDKAGIKKMFASFAKLKKVESL